MTKNKRQVLEALACIDTADNVYPPHHATRVQELLRDNLGYGDFDLANLTRTLKALADQGLVKFSTSSADVSGDTFGCISRRYEREMVQYWPTDLDLDAMRVQYKITPEDYDLRFHNFFQRRYGLPELTMDEFREYNARKAAGR